MGRRGRGDEKGRGERRELVAISAPRTRRDRDSLVAQVPTRVLPPPPEKVSN